MLKVAGSNVIPTCCGKPMEELRPNTADGKTEYHLPTIVRNDRYAVTVKIGQEYHPMLASHYIQFIYAETKHEGILHFFKSGDIPEVTFPISESPIAIYSYCNLHALWKTDL